MLLLDAVSVAQARRRPALPPGHYDLPLLLAVVALASLGVIMVASSSVALTSGGRDGIHYLVRHLAYLAAGTGLAIAFARTELKRLESGHFLWLVGGVLLLMAVFLPVLGVRINGAHRWIHLGPLSFQPAEAMKLVLIIYLAGYLVRHGKQAQTRFGAVLLPLVVVAGIAGILLVQPDFGSAVLLLGVTVGMLWLGGARMRYLFYLAIPVIPVVIWAATSQSYRVQRLTSFLNPFNDPFDDGFQLVQALIAIGRGEWFGVGLGGSIQKLFYLPEANSDFILAVIGEELGLAGIVLVVGLFATLVWRGLAIGLRGLAVNRDFASYVAFGIALMVGLQAAISIGVNLGVLPTKGLTLPLVSSGGSSLLMTAAMMGVLLRCSREVSAAEEIRRMAVRRPRTATQSTSESALEALA